MRLANFGVGEATPKWGEGVGLGGQNGHIRKCNIAFLLAPLPIVTKALSLTVFAERSNVTDGRTDRRTDRIGIAIADLMLRATR